MENVFVSYGNNKTKVSGRVARMILWLISRRAKIDNGKKKVVFNCAGDDISTEIITRESVPA